MDINAVIDDAVAAASAQEASKDAPKEVVETPKEEPKADEAKQEQTEAPKLTPEQEAKREANRVSHLNSKLARGRREKEALIERIAALEAKASQPQKPQGDGRPKAEDFTNYHDFLKADIKWEREQEQNESATKTKAEQAEQAKLAHIQQAADGIAKKREEFEKSTPEYTALLKENADFLQTMPDHIAAAFLHIDNAPLALFTLMKEGNLDGLESLPPERVLIELARAEARGDKYLTQATKTTNAPAPISPARGSSSSSSLANKSVEELMKQFAYK